MNTSTFLIKYLFVFLDCYPFNIIQQAKIIYQQFYQHINALLPE